MVENDNLQRFIFENAPVRGELIHLQKSFQTVINQHPYPPAIRQLLGEALCVAGLLSAIIKFEGRLTVQFRGKGKLKLLLAQCDNQFNVRGLAKWEGKLSYRDLMDSFNDGVLMIMLDSGAKNRYQGIVSWRGNSLVESIEGYFQDSEQLATKIWLSVGETSAAGMLLQVVPGKERTTDSIDMDAAEPDWMRLTRQAGNLDLADMFVLDDQTLLTKLYPEEEIRLFDALPIQFSCTCSRKRSAEAISILGKEEAEDELKNNKTIVVTCDFCNKEYIFDRADVAKIFEGRPPKKQLH